MTTTMNQEKHCLIIGGGPAGLTAALELSRSGIPATVFEADRIVGGIAQTGEYKGYRYDIGGHRFFTKVNLVHDIWEEILGDDLLERGRLSRIYYNDRFFDYPLRPVNALMGLGPVEALRILLSYLRSRIAPIRDERNFEEWVSNRFGRRLYEIFFKTYTEKVWGMPCTEIRADWAAQRIKNLDLMKAVRHALLGSGKGETVTSLIDSFFYPRLGPGMMWERCRTLLDERGVETRFDAGVVELVRDGAGISRLVTESRAAERAEIEVEQVISSMPVRDLIRSIRPAPPSEVLEAAESLRYRDFLTVVLIVDRDELFPDNWIYIHSPDVKVGRIQNFKNWSPEMVPDPGRTSLGLEYFVQEDDELWSMPDDELVALGCREMAELGLVEEDEVVGGCVLRMPKAYPVYDQGYREALATIRDYLAEIPNLQLIGRNGLHRYNNQDHSMLTGIYAARNLAGESYDLWSVNVDQEYLEEATDETAGYGERLVPGEVESQGLEQVLASAFVARFDAVALGAALAVPSAVAVLVATAMLLLQGNEPVGPTLSLLGNYLFGYAVSWPGSIVGAIEAGALGFGVGWVMARLINLLLESYEISIRRQLQLTEVLDPSNPAER